MYPGTGDVQLMRDSKGGFKKQWVDAHNRLLGLENMFILVLAPPARNLGFIPWVGFDGCLWVQVGRESSLTIHIDDQVSWKLEFCLFLD